MNIPKKSALLLVAFLLVGQGCLSGSSSSAANGSLWVTADVGDNWTQLSALPQPSGVASIAGVSATAIEIDPSDHTAFYMGTLANGLFYTLDSGQSWMRPENETVRSGHIVDVEVHPDDVCTVWVLKQDRILKSTDCMRTFESVYTEGRDDTVLVDFVLDWFNPNILWAGTEAGDVLKSFDGGKSWANVKQIKDEISSITVSHADSRIVLVGTEDKSLWRSVDGGDTWVDYEDTLKEYRGSDEVYGFTQTRDGSVLLMNTKFGLLRSYNAGQTWESIPLLTPSGDVRIWSVDVDPDDGDTIYYGIEGTLYSTTSGGTAWADHDLPSSRVPYAMRVHPSLTDRLMIGFVALD